MKLVSPVPPFVVGRVPVTPVLNGSPVALVRTAADGVPSAGVTSVGLVLNTRLELVVPVVPEAEYPVMLLNAVMLADVAPVPPLATGSAVPESVTASVPLVVIGEPATDKNDGTVIATDETVPVAPADEARSFTVPEEFLKYSFSSFVLSANSPAARLVPEGVADAVAL